MKSSASHFPCAVGSRTTAPGAPECAFVRPPRPCPWASRIFAELELFRGFVLASPVGDDSDQHQHAAGNQKGAGDKVRLNASQYHAKNEAGDRDVVEMVRLHLDPYPYPYR